MPRVKVLAGGALGWLDHDSEAFMNGISVLIKVIPERSFTPSTMWRHSEKKANYETGGKLSPNTQSILALILDF